mmetsp:Transcript_21157/g.71092  ORF Transcript_21157/g.71092 Transcript_21157/m.71092 type:complete len:260 (+) Transcript_21157:137-916(+)
MLLPRPVPAGLHRGPGLRHAHMRPVAQVRHGHLRPCGDRPGERSVQHGGAQGEHAARLGPGALLGDAVHLHAPLCSRYPARGRAVHNRRQPAPAGRGGAHEPGAPPPGLLGEVVLGGHGDCGAGHLHGGARGPQVPRVPRRGGGAARGGPRGRRGRRGLCGGARSAGEVRRRGVGPRGDLRAQGPAHPRRHRPPGPPAGPVHQGADHAHDWQGHRVRAPQLRGLRARGQGAPQRGVPRVPPGAHLRVRQDLRRGGHHHL